MYELVEQTSAEGQLEGVRILLGQHHVIRLHGGQALSVAIQVATLKRRDSTGQRAQDFLHGLVMAITHCAITGTVPSIAMM